MYASRALIQCAASSVGESLQLVQCWWMLPGPHDMQHTDERHAVCSNPMAGTDATLLSLSGAGYADSRSFGFASCPRVVGAAEGMNVLLERRMCHPDGRIEHAYNVTNVEYTEFEKQGIDDVPAAPGSQYSCFPANTNVLYVGLKASSDMACAVACRAMEQALHLAHVSAFSLSTFSKLFTSDLQTYMTAQYVSNCCGRSGR